MSTVILVALAMILSLVVSFFFSGSETAVISASRYRLNHLKDEGNRAAERTLAMLNEPNRLMSAVLVGTNLGNVFAVLTFKYLVGLQWPEVRQPAFWFVQWDEVIALALLTPTIVVFAEILPKALFRARADDWVMPLRPSLRFSMFLFAPAIVLLEGIVNLVLKLVDQEDENRGRRLTKRDLIMMLHQARDTGDLGESGDATRAVEPSEKRSLASTLGEDFDEEDLFREPDERRLIQNIIALEERQAREIMMPLVELEAVHLGQTTLEGFLEMARRSGHSRFPVYRDRIINLIGYIDVYDVLKNDEGRTRLEDFVQPAHYVPETKRVDDLLQEFLFHRINNAIVVDEHGGCTGLVTREDIIEEIVGELEDELDAPQKLIQEQADGSFLVEGRTDLQLVNEVLDADFDDQDIDTLGGLVMRETGVIPSVGDEVQIDGWLAKVVVMDDRRVAQVNLHRLPQAEEED